MLLINRPRIRFRLRLERDAGRRADLRLVSQCHSEKVQIIVHASEMVLHLETKHEAMVDVQIDKRTFIRQNKAGERER